MNNKTKILFFDIETSPHLTYNWAKYEQNALAFKEYSHLLSFSAKWLGGKTITKGLIDYKDKTDKSLVKDIWKLFDEADIVVSQNGVAFDTKRCFARFSLYGMSAPSPFKQVDTKIVAKKYFSFPSNSLNDIADFLRIGRKKETGGFDLWLKCIAGDKAAWKTMLEYNENDVLLLEQVYLRLLPFVNNHPNMGMFYGKEVCTNCGNDKLQSRGTTRNLSGEYQRLMCRKCGHWQRATKKIEKVKTLRNI